MGSGRSRTGNIGAGGNSGVSAMDIMPSQDAQIFTNIDDYIVIHNAESQVKDEVNELIKNDDEDEVLNSKVAEELARQGTNVILSSFVITTGEVTTVKDKLDSILRPEGINISKLSEAEATQLKDLLYTKTMARDMWSQDEMIAKGGYSKNVLSVFDKIGELGMRSRLNIQKPTNAIYLANDIGGNTKADVKRSMAERLGADESDVNGINTEFAYSIAKLNRVAMKNNVGVLQHLDLSGDGFAKRSISQNVAAYYISDQKLIATSFIPLRLDLDKIKKGSQDAKHFEAMGYKNGFTVAGNKISPTAVHEYGHHIENVVFQDNAMRGKKLSAAVSPYGNFSNHEAFAEAFTLYCYDIKPATGKAYYRSFQKLMKDAGLEDFKGCMKD